MTIEIIIVLTILIAAVVLFITEWLKVDIVALLVVASLLLTGILSVDEGFAGFANEGTITIAAMFILSSGLLRTGVVVYLSRAVKNVFKLNFIMASAITFLIVGLLSAFINNTPVVAIFLPILLQVSRDTKISPSKLLLPLSYAAIVGGVCTLIGTSTNLVVNSVTVKSGLPAFSLFEIAMPGVIFLITGICYILFIAMPLLPERKPDSTLMENFGLGDYLTEIILKKESNSINLLLKDSPLVKKFGIEVLEIVRGKDIVKLPRANTRLQENDKLKVICSVERIKEIQETPGILIKPGLKWQDEIILDDYVFVEAIISPRSLLSGKTLKSVNFRNIFNGTVLAIRHRGILMNEKISSTKLLPGDTLLIEIHKDDISRLKESDAFVLVSQVDPPSFKTSKIMIAIITMAAVVFFSSIEILPISISALCGCLVLILTKCINLDQAYSSIDWSIIFLLAGSLALGTALENTGAAKLIADFIVYIGGGLSPILLLSAFYLITLILTETMSNTATAALLTPIAIVAANSLGVDPKPFLVAIMFAASLAFMSPVGYQTHLLVYNPGGYKILDFIKVGTPLDLLFWIMATFLIPLFFPF